MVTAQTQKIKLVISFSIILLILVIGTCLCKAQDQCSVVGELKIVGEHVEHLVLLGKDGHSERLDKPAETIELPVGQYQLQESHLNGGYVCFMRAGLQDEWITIAENKPAVLKVGAPLKQIIKVKRRGKALVLDYKLLGIGGESYNNNDRNKPPRFIIYNGDEEINSGRFEYG
jgi:hypothetical protein